MDDQGVSLFHLSPKGIQFHLLGSIILQAGTPFHLKGGTSLQLEVPFLLAADIPHGIIGHLRGTDHLMVDEDHLQNQGIDLLHSFNEDHQGLHHSCAVGLRLPHAIGPQFKAAGDHPLPYAAGGHPLPCATGGHLLPCTVGGHPLPHVAGHPLPCAAGGHPLLCAVGGPHFPCAAGGPHLPCTAGGHPL